VLEEGSSHNYWECTKLGLSLDKLHPSEQTDYQGLIGLLDVFADVMVCFGHRSEFYDYIYIYNLVRTKSKEVIRPGQQLFYK